MEKDRHTSGVSTLQPKQQLQLVSNLKNFEKLNFSILLSWNAINGSGSILSTLNNGRELGFYFDPPCRDGNARFKTVH